MPQPSPSRSTITPEALRSMSPNELKTLLGELKVSARLLRKSVAGEEATTFLTEILGLTTPKHVLEWLEILETKNKLLVEASRDHFKSWTFSYAYPLYRIQRAREPGQAIHIALISYSEHQAKKNLARIRKQVESNKWLKWLRPTLKSYTWDTGLLNFSNDCSIEAFGFGSSIRGGHYDLVVIDDPCKARGTGSMSVEDQIAFFAGTIIPAVKKRGVGQLVITGNPVDKVDFLCSIETNPEFFKGYYPAILSNGEPLCPEHYTLEDIEEKRRTIPTHIFAREYLLKRVSSADAKFREEWIKYYDPARLSKRPFNKVMTIDPALSPGGDAMAAIVTGTDVSEDVYILDHMRFRGNFKDGIGKLCDMMERNLPDFIGCEVFAFQAMDKVWLEEEIQRRGLNFLWGPKSKTNDDDLIDALAWQVGLWSRPYGDDVEPVDDAPPGSFNEALEQMRADRSGHYLVKLFEDMGSQ